MAAAGSAQQWFGQSGDWNVLENDRTISGPHAAWVEPYQAELQDQLQSYSSGEYFEASNAAEIEKSFSDMAEALSKRKKQVLSE
ncbi:MAG: hypothetical protein AAFV45_00455 [Pseudomonadota bacterium]